MQIKKRDTKAKSLKAGSIWETEESFSMLCADVREKQRLWFLIGLAGYGLEQSCVEANLDLNDYTLVAQDLAEFVKLYDIKE